MYCSKYIQLTSSSDDITNSPASVYTLPQLICQLLLKYLLIFSSSSPFFKFRRTISFHTQTFILFYLLFFILIWNLPSILHIYCFITIPILFWTFLEFLLPIIDILISYPTWLHHTTFLIYSNFRFIRFHLIYFTVLYNA